MPREENDKKEGERLKKETDVRNALPSSQIPSYPPLET